MVLKRPSVGPRDLTPTMLRSIEEADKPAKRDKKPELQKEGTVTKPSKGQTPKKRKTDKAAPSQPQPKKQKKPARRLIPPKQKNALPSDSDNESSDEEASDRGDTLPRSHTPGIPSEDDDNEPITKRHLKAVNDKLDQLLSSSSSSDPSEAALKALFSSVVVEHSATLSAAAKAIEASSSQCQQASIAVDASTKECKEETAKVDKLVSEAHLFLDSLQAAAAKNAATIITSLETLQKTLQSECSNLEAACHAIEEANASLHAKVNERLTQMEADLAMENRIMDELDRHTAQLKLQLHKVRTANTEINDLKSERESILLHLIEASDPLITITVRRHLADKLRLALDILSRIEGVPVTGVQPKQGGEKESKQQPPSSSSKPAAEPKVNEASVSNKDKKKKKIGEDDTDNEDDVYVDIPKKPVPKDNTSEKQTEEITKK
uniref:Uncharacterized protein n=1 Tax=Lactuca sativa TaxID=4236 RepID=A0A9R1XRB9_LACSA|nr:hypothetical protein LSAT_V11C300155180 [Lactuca sativa]